MQYTILGTEQYICIHPLANALINTLEVTCTHMHTPAHTNTCSSRGHMSLSESHVFNFKNNARTASISSACCMYKSDKFVERKYSFQKRILTFTATLFFSLTPNILIAIVVRHNFTCSIGPSNGPRSMWKKNRGSMTTASAMAPGSAE